MMNQKKAMEIVNKLIYGLQRARTASREGVEAMGKSKRILKGEVIDNVLEDLTPWLHGEKAEAFLNGLVMVSDRGSVKGGELYNFMYIIHHLDPTIAAMAGAMADYDFPEPDMGWFADLGM